MEQPKLIQEKQFIDDRGKFIPSFIDKRWIQTNVSVSKRGVFRGMHFQIEDAAQAKLVRVLNGAVLDIIIDLRNKDSNPDYLKLSSFDLRSNKNEETYPRLYIPKGFAHGFLALENNTIFEYQVDAEYNPQKDRSINWKSLPVIKDLISKYNFSADTLIISEKDTNAPMLEDWLKLNEKVMP